jgi:RNA polymerase sigma-70 factor (ECF subfamily)
MARVGRTYIDTRTEESCGDHDLTAERDVCTGKIPLPADPTTAVHLIQRVANQDREAFSQLYERFSTLVFTLAMRMLRTRSEAEDLLQEVFVQVWRQAQGYSAEQGSPEAWIINIARIGAIDKIRSIRRMGRSFVSADSPRRTQLGETIGSWTAGSEVRMTMNSALANLPESQRKALELAYLDGMTQTEIAERLAEPLDTIKARMRAGIQRLREIVSSQVV